MTPADFKFCRVACNLTQSEWAMALGYRLKSPRQQVNDMESGRKPISPVTAHLAAIYRQCGVPTDFIDGPELAPIDRLVEMYRRFGVPA